MTEWARSVAKSQLCPNLGRFDQRVAPTWVAGASIRARLPATIGCRDFSQGRAMSLEIATRWFDYEHLADGITRLWEPHVIRVMQCNIWHVQGRDRDLVVDTGMGVASL